MKTLLTLALSLIVITVAHGQGTVLWDETLNGPLSGTSSAPTMFGTLHPGTNTIIGKTEIEPLGGTWVANHDFFAFAVPSDSLIGATYLEIDTPNVWHWIGDASFLGELAFSGNPHSGELLSQWGLNFIASGSYGMYVGNANAQPVPSVASYRLDFVVVPESSALALFLAGGGILFAFDRRFR